MGTRIGREDLKDFQDFYADPEVMRTLSADGRVWPRRDSASLFERHLEHWDEHGFGTWIFRDAPGGAFVGRAGLRSVDVGNGPQVELFYGIDSGMWGQGLATEIARAIIEAAFEVVGLDHLIGFTLPTNVASRRVMQKCGFRRVGEVVHADLEHFLFRLDASPDSEDGASG